MQSGNSQDEIRAATRGGRRLSLVDFDGAIELIRRGPGQLLIARLLEELVAQARCRCALLWQHGDDAIRVLSSARLPVAYSLFDLPAGAISVPERAEVIPDTTKHPAFRKLSIVAGPPSWRVMVIAPLPLANFPGAITIALADERSEYVPPPNISVLLESYAKIAADEITLLADIATLSSRAAPVKSSPALARLSHELPWPVAMLDAAGEVLTCSDQFSAMIADCPLDRWQITRYHGAVSRASLLDAVAEVASTGKSFAGYLACDPDQTFSSLVAMSRHDNPFGRASVVVIVGAEGDFNEAYTLQATVARTSGEPPGITSDFLLSTLVRRLRVIHRGTTSYHAMHRWRTPIKDTQIAALRALKRAPPNGFVEVVGVQLAEQATALFGSGTFDAVVPVPCGNSGPGCLSEQLAQVVAEKLGLPAISAFAPLSSTGGSHPRGISRRQEMVLNKPIGMPVLLIDDVATSGAHIDEAALRLRAASPAVLPLVWVAS